MPEKQTSHVRYLIVLMLFVASTFSYGDRVVLSISALEVTRTLHLDPLQIGYLLSAFSWAYVCGQLPAGGLLDRYGSKRVYGTSIICWSVCALLAGLCGYLPVALAFFALFAARFISGLAQSPVFPGNGRIVAAWFPTSERGRASAIFNSSQYFSLVLFAPIMGWVVHRSGWRACFWLEGIAGLGLAIVWYKTVYSVKTHPRISSAEVEYIEAGGGLASLDAATRPAGTTLTWRAIRVLLSNRMLLGIFLGQYCITTLTWFFLTWFPIYLGQARHISIVKVGLLAALPALCGFAGGILGGVISDLLLRRGHSLTFARKLPIVLGMLMAMTMIGCNYVNTSFGVMLLMSIAFFGKGIGALGWTVISDTSPKNLIGITGALFNLIGNLAGITTPIVIGLIVQHTGSFKWALIYVAAAALLAIVAYLPIVGEIKRLDSANLFIGAVTE